MIPPKPVRIILITMQPYARSLIAIPRVILPIEALHCLLNLEIPDQPLIPEVFPEFQVVGFGCRIIEQRVHTLYDVFSARAPVIVSEERDGFCYRVRDDRGGDVAVRLWLLRGWRRDAGEAWWRRRRGSSGASGLMRAGGGCDDAHDGYADA
jgi:hypothetical protein